MKQIVTKFTDQDMYTFTCQYYILHTYPRAEVRYSFFDRNHTRYPEGFGKLLQEQIDGMKDVVITEEEIAFMKSKIYFLPEWYYNFLRGYRFNPSEVHIFQDLEGYLSIMIEGKWYSTIMWEMPILSTISELMHIVNGDMRLVNLDTVFQEAFEKGKKLIDNGVSWSDMGTRRRFSFEVQREVIRGLKAAQEAVKGAVDTDTSKLGKFVGTSNVWFAKEFNLGVIGTMSHQIVSAEECVSGVFECNYQVMDKWSRCFNGDVGIFLYDNFSDVMFFPNLSKRLAKTFDGLRVDSGDEKEQTEKIIEKYRSLGIDPSTKAIVYSNALTIDKAIELHKWVNGRMKDSVGIGTHLCADVSYLWCETLGTPMAIDEVKDGKTIRGNYPVEVKKFPYSNIVIKLTGFRITESREWQDCVKLSNDKGKMLGNKEKCEYILNLIKNCKH
jgi:nicotinate phosphoribosyltransferase